MELIIPLLFSVILSVIIGWGPSFLLCPQHPNRPAIAMALALPLGTVILTGSLTNLYYLAWSVGQTFWPFVLCGILISLVLFAWVKRQYQGNVLFSLKIPKVDCYLLLSLFLICGSVTFLPYLISPPNWSTVRMNPGDQNTYMHLAKAVKMLSYHQWKAASLPELYAITPLGINLYTNPSGASLYMIGPAAGVLLAAISIPFKSGLLQMIPVLNAYLTLCVASAAYALGLMLSFDKTVRYSVVLITALGFWPVYLRDMSAYAHVLQLSNSLMIILVISAIVQKLSDAHGNKMNSADKRDHPDLIGWREMILSGFLIGSTLIFYKEFFAAIIVPAGFGLVLFALIKLRVPFLYLTVRGLLIGLIAIFWFLPGLTTNLKDVMPILSANLTSLKVDAGWHMAWISESLKNWIYWDLSCVASYLRPRSILFIYAFRFITFLFVVLLLRTFYRFRNDPKMIVLMLLTLISVGIGSIFLMKGDIYRGGKALGFLYFMPIVCLAYGAGLQPATCPPSRIPRGYLFFEKEVCKWSLVFVLMLHLLFNSYYLLNSFLGKELSYPYVSHDFIFRQKKINDFNLVPFREALADSRGNELIADVENVYVNIASSFYFERNIVGNTHSKIDTDVEKLPILSLPLRSNVHPAYVLTDRGYKESIWSKAGLEVVTRNDTLVLMQGNIEDIRRTYNEIIRNAFESIKYANLICFQSPQYRSLGLDPAYYRYTGTAVEGSASATSNYFVLYFYSTDTSPLRIYLRVLSNNAQEAVRFTVNRKSVEKASQTSNGNEQTTISAVFSPQFGHNALEVYAESKLQIAGLGFLPDAYSPSLLGSLETAECFSPKYIENAFGMTPQMFEQFLSSSWLNGDSALIHLFDFASPEDVQWGRGRWTTKQRAGILLPGIQRKHSTLTLKVVPTRFDQKKVKIYHNGRLLGEDSLMQPGTINKISHDFVPDIKSNFFEIESSSYEPPQGSSHGRGIFVLDSAILFPERPLKGSAL